MKEIPPGRKKLYYGGMILTGIGVITFFSVVISTALHFNDSFDRMNGPVHLPMLYAIAGGILTMAGQLIMRIGSRGTAGSGLILNPTKAERDLEPWARMGGGLLKGALEEAGVNPTGNSPLSFADKIRSLEGLKKEGLITDAEFQAKRKEIFSEKL